MFNMSDLFSTFSTMLAILAIMAAFFAMAIDLRSRRRKAERDKIVSVIKREIPNLERVSQAALADMESFIEEHLAQSEELRLRLKQDLQRVALMAIIDDRVILQMASSLRAHFESRKISENDRARLTEFVFTWLRSKDQSDLTFPEKAYEARKNAEYQKKKIKLGHELEKALA